MREVVLASLAATIALAADLSLPGIVESQEITRHVEAHYGVKGTCSVFSINEEAPTKCDGVLLVNRYKGERYAVELTRGQSTLLFFVASFAVNSRVQVDGLAIGQTTGSASGTCRIGDPYHGNAIFDCEAQGAAGAAHIVFTSDGSKPIKVNV